ncbi:MAG: PilZ domain-containing protein [Terriglobales bacterium]
MIKAQTWSANQNVLPAERRRYLRVQVAVQIEIRPAGTNVPMRLETSDVSLGGCYVEMALTLDVGTKLDIVLWLDQAKVSTKGLVVTRHPQFGNGIAFLQLSSENEARLRAFLDAHDGSWQA